MCGVLAGDTGRFFIGGGHAVDESVLPEPNYTPEGLPQVLNNGVRTGDDDEDQNS